jgi:hypothetical protein
MDSFQMIVLAIATLVLIIILSVIGIALNKLKNTVSYPPIANNCPDYWDASGPGICRIPLSNKKNTGTIYGGGTTVVSGFASPPTYGYTPGTTATINFNDQGWLSNKSATCNKQIWAKKYGIVWDGISNYNSC